MNSILYRFFTKPLQITLIIWSCLAIFTFMWIMFSGSTEIGHFAYFTFIFSYVVSVSGIYHSQALAFLRVFSSSLSQFWRNYLLHILAVFYANLLFLIMFNMVFPVASESQLILTIWDYMWVFILALLLTVSILHESGSAVEKRSKIPFLLQVLLGFIILGIFAFLFTWSRILSFIFLSLALWFFFTQKNIFFLNSFHKILRKKIIVTGYVLLIGLFAVSAGFEYVSLQSKPSYLLGSLNPYKKLVSKHMNSINSPETWIQWYESKGLQFTLEEKLQGLQALASYCPPEYSDAPLRIICRADRDVDSILLFGFRMSEDEIAKLLETQSYYANLVGLLQARHLSVPLPEGIKQSVERLGQMPGNLSAVALKTLNRSVPDSYPSSARLDIRERSRGL